MLFAARSISTNKCYPSIEKFNIQIAVEPIKQIGY